MNTTLKLIERQLAMSEILKRLDTTATRPGRYVNEDGIAFGPYLLISRECGSGGGRLAQLAAAELGWNVFDSKIVSEIAKVAHVHQRLVQAVDEHIHSIWEQNWREFLLDGLPDRKYLQHLRQVVMTLGHLGDVVLVGRGAEYFLPHQCGLRVRVVAPLELRARNLADNEKLSLDQARAKAKAVDAERNAFIWKVFKKDVCSPLNHDVVVNTGEMSLETAAEIVLAMLKKKLSAKSESQPEPGSVVRG